MRKVLVVALCAGSAAAFAPTTSSGLRAAGKAQRNLCAPRAGRSSGALTTVKMNFLQNMFGGAAAAPVGDIAQVAPGWVNPEFMRGFTFDTATQAAPYAVGASSLGGVNSPSAGGGAKENQDGVALMPDVGNGVAMYSVFDGHGEYGGQVTQWAIGNLPNYVAQAVAAGRAGELLNRVTDAYRAADTQLETDLTYKTIEDSGTTVATVLVKGDLLLAAGLGDSRVVLGVQNPDGTLAAQPVTRDQAPVVPAEVARIEANGGEVRQEGPGGRVYAKGKSYPGLAVARALGDGDAKNYGVTADPQFIGWKVRAGMDFALILASDGVWNALGNENVVEIVAPWRTTRDAQSAAEAVVATARQAWEENAKGRIDDISAVVLFLDQ